MKGDFVHLGAGALSQNSAHDEFLKLCALCATGDLSPEEHKKLNEHLAVCPTCRDAFEEYQLVVNQAMPSIASAQQHRNLRPGPRWSQRAAEERFFDRLGRGSKKEHKASEADRSRASGFSIQRVPSSSESAWNHMWILYAAGILLFAALSLFTYRIGMHRGSNMSELSRSEAIPASGQDQTALEAQLSDASHDRAMSRTQIAQREKAIADLKRQLARQSDEINQLRTAEHQLQTQLQNDKNKTAEFAKQQSDLAQRLESAEGNSSALQEKLNSLAQESTQDAIRAKNSEAKVNELTKLLQDRESAIEQQEQMLAHDRDIRELMGARDLYIAEVYDVGDGGETKKPYGRVFYTRGKSLIFYAYDLDQQAQLKRANTFQAWGRRGPDRQHAVNLGIFYEDNASKKRWVMKCADPRSLAQIDGVFVTVEPNGGSHKPSDKTLLFAYLKVNPNHP
jgi:hypothetical protein